MHSIQTGRIKALLLRPNLVYIGDAFGDVSAMLRQAAAAAAIKKRNGSFLFYCGSSTAAPYSYSYSSLSLVCVCVCVCSPLDQNRMTE